MIHPITLWPDDVLKKDCKKIDEINEDILSLAHDLLDTMYDSGGRGLAAPQIGKPLRMFVMDCGWKLSGNRNATVMINPEIIGRSDDVATGTEACLSIPGIEAEVERSKEVTMRWTVPDASITIQRLTGAEAVCAQHECDHLEGRVIFDLLSDDARAKLEQTYHS
ncbi:MAG: peptide deformylase [Boseongicola sp.]|nr:MAG: peptide deformylase [Boseongicola sp.]